MCGDDASESEGIQSIEELLSKLGLTSFQPVFEKEHIDMETLVTIATEIN